MLNRLLPDKRFARDVFTLISGTTLAQAIPFLMLPILQRYFFSPADFGLLAVFTSFAEIFILAAALRYELAIVMQQRLKNAVNALGLSFFFVSLTTIIALLLIIIFHGQIVGFLEEPAIGPFLYLVPVSILMAGSFKVFSYWYNRSGDYGLISGSKISQTVSGEGAKLATGMAGLAGGLIIGRLIGQAFSVLFFAFLFARNELKKLRLLSVRQMKHVFNSNKEFAFFSTPSTFITSSIYFVYINLFLKFYGTEFVGTVGVSMMYIGVAFTIISGSFSQVFYGRIATINAKPALRRLYLRFALALFAFSFFVLLVIFAIPKSLVVYLLGDEWFGLMPVLRIMVCWLAISFVSSSLSFIYIKVRRQRTMVVFDLFHMFLVIASIMVAHQLYGDAITTLWFFAGAQVLYYLVAIFAALFFINRFTPEGPSQSYF